MVSFWFLTPLRCNWGLMLQQGKSRTTQTFMTKARTDRPGPQTMEKKKTTHCLLAACHLSGGEQKEQKENDGGTVLTLHSTSFKHSL